MNLRAAPRDPESSLVVGLRVPAQMRTNTLSNNATRALPCTLHGENVLASWPKCGVLVERPELNCSRLWMPQDNASQPVLTDSRWPNPAHVETALALVSLMPSSPTTPPRQPVGPNSRKVTLLPAPLDLSPGTILHQRASRRSWLSTDNGSSFWSWLHISRNLLKGRPTTPQDSVSDSVKISPSWWC